MSLLDEIRRARTALALAVLMPACGLLFSACGGGGGDTGAAQAGEGSTTSVAGASPSTSAPWPGCPWARRRVPRRRSSARRRRARVRLRRPDGCSHDRYRGASSGVPMRTAAGSASASTTTAPAAATGSSPAATSSDGTAATGAVAPTPAQVVVTTAAAPAPRTATTTTTTPATTPTTTAPTTTAPTTTAPTTTSPTITTTSPAPPPTPPSAAGSGVWTFDLDALHAGMGLYVKGEAGTLVATRVTAGAAPYPIGVHDFKGVQVATLADPTELGNGSVAYILPTATLGYFELRPIGGDANAMIPKSGTRPAGRLTYAVVNPPDPDRSRGFTNIFANIQGMMSLPNSTMSGYDAYPYLGISSVGTKEYSWFMCNLPDGFSPTTDAACDNRLAKTPTRRCSPPGPGADLLHGVAAAQRAVGGLPDVAGRPRTLQRVHAQGRRAHRAPLRLPAGPLLPDVMGAGPDLEDRRGFAGAVVQARLRGDPRGRPEGEDHGPDLLVRRQRIDAGLLADRGHGRPAGGVPQAAEHGAVENYLDAISWHDYPQYNPAYYYKPELLRSKRTWSRSAGSPRKSPARISSCSPPKAASSAPTTTC